MTVPYNLLLLIGCGLYCHLVLLCQTTCVSQLTWPWYFDEFIEPYVEYFVLEHPWN